MRSFSLFAGTSSHGIASAISRILDHHLSPCQVEVFPDGELSVRPIKPGNEHPPLVHPQKAR